MSNMNVVGYYTLTIVLLLCLVSTVFSCSCQNNGICSKDNTKCTCKSGYYGTICTLYAESYQITYSETPISKQTAKDNLKKALEIRYNIQNITSVYPGNIFKLTFYQTLSSTEVKDIETIAKTVAGAGSSFGDFNECEIGLGQQICYSDKCVNTEGSFKCGCKSGEALKGSICVAEEDNTRTVIYIWAAVVVAVILVMIGFIMFYKRKKVEKGKKLQKEIEKKHAARNSLTPTNLEDFNGPMRRSPVGSVFDAPLGGPVRPMSAIYNPDATSLYSYNSRMYPQSEPDYSRHRLSAPVLENYVNNGYDQDVNPRSYSASNPGSLPSSYPGLNGIQEDRISMYSTGTNGAIIPTRYPSDLQLVREDRYEQY